MPARTIVASSSAYSSSASTLSAWNTRDQTPLVAQRLKRRWTFFPVAEALRQVAPGHAGPIAIQDGIHEQAVVTRRPAHMPRATR
jgi:hypothetical protein